jgi:hypothetical protein
MAGNNQIDIFENELETFPRSTSLVGTIETANRNDLVVGTGTSFTTDFQVDDWIFVAALGEVKKIKHIVSDTQMHLYQEFSAPVAPGAVPRKVKNPAWRSVSWAVIAQAVGPITIDGCAVPVGLTDSDDKTGGPMMVELPNPIIIDTSAGAGDQIKIVSLK